MARKWRYVRYIKGKKVSSGTYTRTSKIRSPYDLKKEKRRISKPSNSRKAVKKRTKQNRDRTDYLARLYGVGGSKLSKLTWQNIEGSYSLIPRDVWERAVRAGEWGIKGNVNISATAGSQRAGFFQGLGRKYKELDLWFRGALPGGYSFLGAKAVNTGRRAQDQRDLNESQSELYAAQQVANRDKARYTQLQDLIDTKWYERFGLGRSAEEKAFQEQMRQEAYMGEMLASQERFFLQMARQIPQTATAQEQYQAIQDQFPGIDVPDYSAQYPQQGGLLSGNTGKMLLIGGGILAIALIANKK